MLSGWCVAQPLDNTKNRIIMENINLEKGDDLFISATYVMKHEISNVHVINIKMAKGIPTEGIDLFVSDDVILTLKK